jgi:putative heme-binding domain-containing protein
MSAEADRRADAIALAALAGVAGREAQFQAWVAPREPEAVQIAALKALASVPEVAVGRFALSAWPTLTPGARSAAVDLLLADPARQRLLVDALKAGTVQSWAMNFGQKRRLIMHRDEALRADARALLEDRPEARAAIVNRYAAAVERGGDSARGAKVFSTSCAPCHKLGEGTASSDLGPDLSGIRHRPPLSLLVDVLSPNQAIAQGYETYLIEHTDGRSDAGTLAEQTPTTVTLRQAGQPIVIARRDIRQITMVPQSSMPADLDKVISPQDMADLLAFLTRR